MRLPNPSPVLDRNRAPMGPEILSSTGAGVWRKAPMAFIQTPVLYWINFSLRRYATDDISQIWNEFSSEQG